MTRPSVVEVPTPQGQPRVIEVTGSAPRPVVVEVPAPSPRDGVIEVHVAGQQGPPGRAAQNQLVSYVHEQLNVASQSWLVQHNLGYRPGGFHVTDLEGNDVEPTIQHMNENVALLTFYAPTAGTATIS